MALVDPSSAMNMSDCASQENVVEKSGTWFSYDGDRIGQGREQAKTFLKEHPAVLQKIEGQVLEKFGVKRGAAAHPAEADEAPEEKKGRVKAVK